MAKYRIYEQCIVDMIYEVEASSEEEARSKWESGLINTDQDWVGESDYEATGKVDVEFWDE